MDKAVEQDFLSGIEPLSNSETSTPHHSKLRESLIGPDSLNSTEDPMNFPLSKPGFSPSPVKPISSYSSPMVTPSNVFTNAAQEITKKLQDSLASSLKREKEVEAALSPGLKRNSSSQHNTPTSHPYSSLNAGSSPQKQLSPTKYSVRFKEDLTSDLPQHIELSSEPSPFNFETPNKTKSPLKVPTSPSKRNSSFAQREDSRLRSLDNELSFLTSIKLPQNEEEKEKLFEFMRRMETSSSGDPLSSLYLLGNSLGKHATSFSKQSEMETKVEADQKTERETQKVIDAEHGNKKLSYQFSKKKPDATKENFNRAGKQKPKTMKENPKEPAKKQGPQKKNSQKSTHPQPWKRQMKATQGSKKDEPNKNTARTEVPVSSATLFTAEGQETINNMEAVRNHLQGMLKMNGSNVNEVKHQTSKENIMNSLNSKTEEEGPESFRSNDTATLLSVQPSDLLPPTSSPDLSAGDMGALINSATSSIFSILRGQTHQQPSSARSSIDSSLAAENNILRDTLEKERYRRNHCEKQIQKLQNKLLELQQELAVGQSVTRKKDMMIEQLDKTLAKVVEGWKTHELNLAKSVQQLTTEKEKNKIEVNKHRDIISKLQSDLSKALNELSEAQEKLQLKQEEQKMLQQTFQLKTHEISRVIDQKNRSIEDLLNGKQTMVDEMKELTRQIEEQQRITEDEKEKFQNKEEEWKEEMQELQKKLKEEMKQEKVKTEQERARFTDLQKVLSSTQQEVRRLEDLMDSLRQGLESAKMQNSVDEAKYSATIRKMEAEHQINTEKKVTEKLTKLQEDAEIKEKELRDNHHKQIMDITASHQTELESLCRRYEDRIEQIDKKTRHQMEEKEEKFNEMLKEKTENMRRQMMNKMQNLLQAHYNETLELVGSTTGNTPRRPIQSANVSLMMQDMQNSTYMSGSQRQDILGLNASTMLFKDSLRQTNSRKNAVLSSDFVNPTQPKMPASDSFSGYPTHFTAVAPQPPLAAYSQAITSAFSKFPQQTCSNDVGQKVETDFLAGELDEKKEVEGIQDISILSGISQSIVTSIQPSVNKEVQNGNEQEFVMKSGGNTFLQENEKVMSTNATNSPMTQNVYQAEINLPSDSMFTPQVDRPSQSTDVTSQDRREQLQHYIKMLLDKSPGEPLEAPVPTSVPIQDRMQPIPPPSIMSLSPIVIPSRGDPTREENKENNQLGAKQDEHLPSEIAIGVMNFLNQQLRSSTHQPSPDLIPLEKTKIQNLTSQSPKRVMKTQHPTRTSAFQLSKVTGQPIAFRKAPANQSPKKMTGQTKLTLKDLDDNKTKSTMHHEQFGEVSRMLSEYMNGDTQEAAEKLLLYLTESQSKGNHDASMTSNRTSKNKSKSRTPSKSGLPAWR